MDDSNASGLSTVLRSIAENINDSYVQQFLANQISALRILSDPSLQTSRLELLHAYPFAAVQERNEALGVAHHATESMLRDAIEQFAKETGTPFREVLGEITQRGTTFASNLNSIKDRRVIPSSLDLKTRIDEIAAEVPLFNSLYRPLHHSDLLAIAAKVGVRVISVPGLILLSLCASARIGDEEVETVVFVKDDVLHPALIEFLIAHELGHYWLHTRPDRDRRSFEDLYLRSALDWGHIENEADSLALVLLFPTPYLSWCEHEDRLDTESVLADFTRGMPAPPAAALYDRMRDYIQKRIDSYRLYKINLDHGGFLPRDPLTTAQAQMVIELLADDRCWFATDQHYVIRNCSRSFAALFDLSPRVLVERNWHVINDLTSRDLQERVERLLHDPAKERATFFFSDLHNIDTGAVVTVTVTALRIVDRGAYEGTLALVTPRRPGEVSCPIGASQDDVPADRGFPFVRRSESLRLRFERLRDQWLEESAVHSLLDYVCTLKSYQEIIGMGRDVVPLLLEELERRPDRWFWALQSITGVDPVPAASRGRMKEMTAVWLEWGRRNNFGDHRSFSIG
jgi:hypothetical protein